MGRAHRRDRLARGVRLFQARAHGTRLRRDFADRLAAMGFQQWPTSAAEAQEILSSEVARWTKVIRDEKIQSAN